MFATRKLLSASIWRVRNYKRDELSMRFALLCNDSSAMPIVDTLCANNGEHRLTHVVQLSSPSDILRLGRPAVTFVDHWEDLLGSNEIDAVLIGGNDPLVLEGAKQLATAGIPLLFVPLAAQGSTFIYELSLIRDDNHVTLYPLMWHRFDSAVVHLCRALREGQIGRVQFLQLQRSLARSTSGSPILQADADAEFLKDADLMRWLVGDYDQVTTLRTAASSDGVLMQSTVLAGRSLPQANWSIEPEDGPGKWELTVRGESGIAKLTREPSSNCWVCEINGQRVKGDEQSTARDLLVAFAGSVQKHATQHADSQDAVGDEWGELVKCFETVDATHRSVARRRTIELHFEPMSERAIFKTQMTAIGCGLLVATLLLTLGYLGIASLIPLPSAVLVGLRAIVFAPLVVFLVAQVLLPLTRPSSSEPKSTQ